MGQQFSQCNGPMADSCAAGEEIQCSEVLEPGAYRSVCVELDVAAFAVNAVVNAHSLDDFEASSI